MRIQAKTKKKPTKPIGLRTVFIYFYCLSHKNKNNNNNNQKRKHIKNSKEIHFCRFEKHFSVYHKKKIE